MAIAAGVCRCALAIALLVAGNFTAAGAQVGSSQIGSISLAPPPPPPRASSAPAAPVDAVSRSVPVYGPIDRVTGLPLPLYSDEKIVPFLNGCAMVTPKESNYSGWVLRWYGGCKFGLAHGRGYYFAKKDDFVSATTSTFRHGVRTGSGGNDTVLLPAGLNGGIKENVSAQPAIVPNGFDEPSHSLRDRNGYPANFIAATWAREVPGRVDEDQLWINKTSCYVEPGSANDLADSVRRLSSPSLPEPLIAQVVAYCLKANERLKAEGGGVGSSDPTPFYHRDYGYYYVVYRHRWAYDPSRRDGYGNLLQLIPENQQYPDVHLCAQLDSLASCEPIWRRLQAPFVKRRDELIQLIKTHNAEREQRFVPLEAAWRAKIAALVKAPEKAPPSSTKSMPKRPVKRKT